MDGKGGEIMDLAMPIGAAVASSYGPSYARGAAIGSQMYMQNRERRDQLRGGERLADTIVALKGQDIDAQGALATQERNRLIDTGWKPAEDGRLMRVNDLGETEFTQDPMNTYNPQVNPLYAAAETLAASGNINQAANFLSQANAQASQQRRDALQVAAQRERDDAQRQFQIRLNEIENEQALALENSRFENNLAVGEKNFGFQKELFNMETQRIADQWELGAADRALDRELRRAQIITEEGRQTELILNTLEDSQDGAVAQLNALRGEESLIMRRAQEDELFAQSPEFIDAINGLAERRDAINETIKGLEQQRAEIRSRLPGYTGKDVTGEIIKKNDGDSPDVDSIGKATERWRFVLERAGVSDPDAQIEQVLSMVKNRKAHLGIKSDEDALNEADALIISLAKQNLASRSAGSGDGARIGDYRGVEAGPWGGSADSTGSLNLPDLDLSFTGIFGGEELANRHRLKNSGKPQVVPRVSDIQKW